MAEKNAASIDDLVGISDLVEKGRFESALSIIDYKGIQERDALYAGVALGLAKELDLAQNDKMPRSNYISMVQRLMDYCADNSKYLKDNKGGQ